MFDFNTLKRGVDGLSKQYREAVGQLEQAKQRIEYLESAPAQKADMLAMIEQYIDVKIGQLPATLAQALSPFIKQPFDQPTDHGSSLGLRIVSACQHGVLPNAMHIEANMLGLFGPQLKQAVGEAIARMDWPRDAGPPLAERRREMDRLTKQIEKLETDIAELREQAAGAGITLRADA